MDMKVIVAPKNTHISLLQSLRQNDPFLDIKLVSKEELSHYLYPSIIEAAIIYLMSEYHYSYEASKNYLLYLPYVTSDSDDHRLHFLFDLKEDLKRQGFLMGLDSKTMPFKEASIIGYPKEDFELVSILNSLNIKYDYLSLEEGTLRKEISIYEKMEDEVYSTLNSVSELIDSHVSIKDIYILRRNTGYDYYLNKFSNKFGYQVNIKSSTYLISTGGAKLFLKLYKDNKDKVASLSLLKEEMKDDPLYLEIEDVVNRSYVEGLSFDIQYDYLVNKLKEQKTNPIIYDNAVRVIDSPLYDLNKHVFVLGFAQGEYPLSGKDTGFLNDKDLKEIGILNAKERTKIDALNLLSYFKTNNTFYFSLSKRTAEGEKYPSPLVDVLKLENKETKLSDSFYSEEVLKLIYADLKDSDFFYKEKSENYLKVRDVISINYNSYDNSYSQKANVYNSDSQIVLSTSSLNKYMLCPFSYYLEKIIKLDEYIEGYSQQIGNIAHKMFQLFREKDFDFEKEYQNEISKYQFSPSDLYTLNHSYKEQVKIALAAIKLREEKYTNAHIENEKKFYYQLTKNTGIIGYIDNFVTLDNKYYICIDYKTGGTKFDTKYLEFGLSSQLPTYSLLISSSDEYKDFITAGLFINNVISNSPNVEVEEDELIPNYLKLNGKVLGDLSVIHLIDPTIVDGDSAFINSVKIKKNGELSGSATVGDQTFNEYMTTVRDLYLKMDEELRKNNFNISPVYKGERDTACSYCQYKDVCFVRNSQFRRLVEEEDE